MQEKAKSSKKERNWGGEMTSVCSRFFSLSLSRRAAMLVVVFAEFSLSLSFSLFGKKHKQQRLTMCASRAPKKHTRMTSTMVRKAWWELGREEGEGGEEG